MIIIVIIIIIIIITIIIVMLWDQINMSDFAAMLYSFKYQEQTKIKSTRYMLFICKYKFSVLGNRFNCQHN